MELFEAFGGIALDSRDMNQLTVESGNHGKGTFAQLPRICRNRLEHRLYVDLRLTDHA